MTHQIKDKLRGTLWVAMLSAALMMVLAFTSPRAAFAQQAPDAPKPPGSLDKAPILDAWMRGEIDENELRERIRFDLDWGYDWAPWRELLETARRSAGCRLSQYRIEQVRL